MRMKKYLYIADGNMLVRIFSQTLFLKSEGIRISTSLDYLVNLVKQNGKKLKKIELF